MSRVIHTLLRYSIITGSLIATGLAQAVTHFSSITTPANIVGERSTTAIVDLAGKPVSDVKVYVVYGTSDAQAKATGSTATYADASCAPPRDGKMRCTMIFPTSRYLSPNTRDVNPKRITRGGRVYFKWTKDVWNTSSTGKRYATTISDSVRNFVMPRRLTVGIFGDSYGSGEGAPYGSSKWSDTSGEDCHRSSYGGLRRGVRDFISQNRNIDVIYRYWACSGAKVADVVVTPQWDSLKSKYVNPKAQMTRMKEFLAQYNYPALDVILVNIGGNDAGFAKIIAACLAGYYADCSGMTYVRDMVNSGLRSLFYRDSSNNPRGWYPYMNTMLRANLHPKWIFITESPDPTRDATGQFCDFPSQSADPDCFGFAERRLNREEAVWVYGNVVVPLNRKIKEAANALGWVMVGDSRVSSDGRLGTTSGIMGRSRNHGICDCSTSGYFNTIVQSYLRQGDKQGAMHPNALGYSRMYRTPVVAALNSVRPAAARRIVSNDRLVSVQTGEHMVSEWDASLQSVAGHKQATNDPLNEPVDVQHWTDWIISTGQTLGSELLDYLIGHAEARNEPAPSPEDDDMSKGPPAGEEEAPPPRHKPTKEAVSNAHEKSKKDDATRRVYHGRPDYKGLPPELAEEMKKQDARERAALEALERKKHGPPPGKGQKP